MTAPSSKKPASGPSDSDAGGDLQSALSARFGMSSENVQAVYELMQRRNLSFSEAAAHLGFLIDGPAEEPVVPKQTDGRSESTGLIETAIRKIASNRQVVVRQGEMVKPGRELILAHNADHPRSEKIRALRTELLLLSEASSGANVIALLSACAVEGRSQLSAELAISFSQLGRRTLLVDADMRQPKQHVLFGSTNLSGLSDAIALNQKPLFHPVDGLSHLSLLTSGSIPSNPLELLSDGRFAKTLEDWRRSYEFVVLDTPPISKYADGLAIATLAGRVIVLSRAQHTSFRDTRGLLRRLATTQSQILGAVINHF
jgi:receptor protein-tyrosine kinase